jgi:hypothetical protein
MGFARYPENYNTRPDIRQFVASPYNVGNQNFGSILANILSGSSGGNTPPYTGFHSNLNAAAYLKIKRKSGKHDTG